MITHESGLYQASICRPLYQVQAFVGVGPQGGTVWSVRGGAAEGLDGKFFKPKRWLAYQTTKSARQANDKPQSVDHSNKQIYSQPKPGVRPTSASSHCRDTEAYY